MEMWFLSMQAMQKILEKLRFYLKESIIDNPVRLYNKSSKTKIKILFIHRLSPDQGLH